MKKKAATLYPRFREEGSAGSYQPIIDSFGKVLVQVDTQDYQGDTHAAVSRAGKYGILVFAWGSCSGCDWLQRCETLDEIDELIDHLRRAVKWFDSWHELVRYAGDHASRELTEFSYTTEQWREFSEKVKALPPPRKRKLNNPHGDTL